MQDSTYFPLGLSVRRLLIAAARIPRLHAAEFIEIDYSQHAGHHETARSSDDAHVVCTFAMFIIRPPQ